jgi:hypothetical protein
MYPDSPFATCLSAAAFYARGVSISDAMLRALAVLGATSDSVH